MNKLQSEMITVSDIVAKQAFLIDNRLKFKIFDNYLSMMRTSTIICLTFYHEL